MAADDSTPSELDDEFLEELRDLAGRVDREPDQVRAGSLAAYSWRTIDAELAMLTSDTERSGEHAADGDAAGDALRLAGSRHLVFEGGGLRVDLEVAADRVLLGRLLPGGTPEVEVCWRGGSTVVPVDGTGRFRAVDVPLGAVSLRCQSPSRGAGPVMTDWVVL